MNSDMEYFSRPGNKVFLGIFVSILLGFLFFQGAHAAWTTGQTTDESFFSGGGYPIVRYNNYEFLGEQPPLTTQLGALPLLMIQPKFLINDPLYVPGTDRIDIAQNGLRFLYKMGNNPNLILFLQRMPILLLTMLLGRGIWLLSSELWGPWGGLLSLALFSFSPNIIAHGSLYTSDMGLAAFYFFTIFALKRFFDAPSEGRLIMLGLACGAALMSKISSLILLPVLSLLFVIYGSTGVAQGPIKAPAPSFEKWVVGISFFLLMNEIGARQAMVLFGPFCLFAFYVCARDIEKVRRSKIFRIVLNGLVLGGAALCLVYCVQLKKKYGGSFALFATVGDLIMLVTCVLVARLPAGDGRTRILKFFLAAWVFAALVIVLGYTDFAYKFYRFIGFGNYMKPLGIVLSHSAGTHGACVEGSFITCDWKYFPGIIAVKTPLLTLCLTFVGAIGLFFSRRPVLIKSIVFVPLVSFLGAAMLNKIHIGLRHILPIYPFLFLLAGYAGSLIGQIKIPSLKKTLAILLVFFVVFSAFRTFRTGPDCLAYFNELVGGSEQGAKLAADSNLSWGQDNRRLAEFVIEKRIPSIKIASETANPELYDYYKIPWTSINFHELTAPRPGYYALGIFYYNAQQKNPASWFYGKKPAYRVGKTFYVFEVPAGNKAE